MTTDQYRQFRSFLFIVAPLLLFLIFLSPGVVAAKSLTHGSWKIVASPSPSASSSYFNGVAAISATNVWAVGYYYNTSSGPSSTLIEHWNGAQWSIVTGPNVSTRGNDLQSVAAISAKNIWAVGNASGQTLTEHWDGSKWSIVSSPNTTAAQNVFTGVAVVSANLVWAVGYASGVTPSSPVQTLIEQWNGTQWSVVSSPNASSSSILFAVARVPKTQKVWTLGSNNGFQTFTEFYTP
jgi:hypothetical protein